MRDPGVNERLFGPPAADADKVEARQARLPAALRALILRAGDALAAGDVRAAQRALSVALQMGPAQPDVLRMYGALLAQIGNHPAAIANLEAALRIAPDDAMGYWQYARVCEDAGDVEAAFRLRRSAVDRLPDSPLAWADLGEHLFAHQGVEAALPALRRAVELAPDYAPGLLKLGNACIARGRTADGTTMIRRALQCEPAFGAAWLALIDVKTIAVTDGEMAQMRALLASRSRIDSGERTAIEFALAAACERAGRYPEAWRLLLDANARRKLEMPAWDVARFREQEQLSDQVFSAPRAAPVDPALGREVIFIVGLPRSGTTLAEQILASHPEVCGAGELAALPTVLTGDSTRRQRRYPEWVPDASAADWHRMGRRYLDLTANFRIHRSYSTDKLPTNWRVLGAIRAMLPGAHIVICRRDPLENCWSCFKQYFPSGWEFANDIGQLGLFWKGFDHAATQWSSRDPGHVREQSYEALTEQPEAQIRGLLDFCGLRFDAACLQFHRSPRSISTLSAAQVREPVYRHRAIAERYGRLLDPLRDALALAPAVTAAHDAQSGDKGAAN